MSPGSSVMKMNARYRVEQEGKITLPQLTNKTIGDINIKANFVFCSAGSTAMCFAVLTRIRVMH